MTKCECGNCSYWGNDKHGAFQCQVCGKTYDLVPIPSSAVSKAEGVEIAPRENKLWDGFPPEPFPAGEPQPSVDHESTVRRQSAALELVKVWRGRMAGSCRMSVECEDEGFKDMDQIYANRAQVYQECADELEEALKGER